MAAKPAQRHVPYAIHLSPHDRADLERAAVVLSARSAPVAVGPRTLAATLVRAGVKAILDSDLTT